MADLLYGCVGVDGQRKRKQREFRSISFTIDGYTDEELLSFKLLYFNSKALYCSSSTMSWVIFLFGGFSLTSLIVFLQEAVSSTTLVTASCLLINSSGFSATELGVSSAEASLDTTSRTRVSGPTDQPVLLDNEAPQSVEMQCFELHLTAFLKGSHI